MATLAYDFLQDDDGDIKIDPITQDFVIGPSDQQHVRDILESVPGWWKKFPLVGFNPYQYLNGLTPKSVINRSAKIAIEGDGYIGVQVDLDFNANGNIKINALKYSRP